MNEENLQVIAALLTLWPECKMVNGKPRHSQSQVATIDGNG